MQPCKDGAQQMTLIIWQQDDLPIQNHSGQFDPSLHAYCKIWDMVENGIHW